MKKWKNVYSYVVEVLDNNERSLISLQFVIDRSLYDVVIPLLPESLAFRIIFLIQTASTQLNQSTSSYHNVRTDFAWMGNLRHRDSQMASL
jgi:hypothetical protein